MAEVLLLSFVFLAAGVLAVPVAARLGLGSVLGYLLAGIAISPLLAAFGVDVIQVQKFAEFGVVMMLFLVGLEVAPRALWQMRTDLLGLGGLQVAGSAAAIMAAAMALGQPWTITLVIGLVMTLSSTAIVLQTLDEKGLMRSEGGKASFAVLLAQDIAVIPMLAFIPLLALPALGVPGAAEGGEAGLSLVAGLPGWQVALVNVAAIAVVVLGGTYATRPLFRYIAMAGLRELFTATALMVVIGIALLMTLVGLSPALGAFLAGVVLANSEYRHELRSDIDPFRGLLLGLFFMTVGASINFALLFASFAPLLGLAVGLMAIKILVMVVAGWIFRLRGADLWLAGFGLSQAGEFSFVLLSFAVANRAMPQSLADPLLLIVAISMLLTPGLFILFEKVIAPRLSRAQERAGEEIDAPGDIIIAGHGRFGGVVNRMLRAAGHSPVVLDYSAAQLEILRTFGYKVFFGDATRPDMLQAAGIETARLLIVAIDDEERINALVRHARARRPDLHIIARAVNRHHVYDLYALGVRDIVRETFDSSVRTGRSAFEALGMHPFEAEQLARTFAEDDKEMLREMAGMHDPDIPAHKNPAYVARLKELRAESEAQMHRGGRAFASRTERGWAPPRPEDVAAAEALKEEGDG